MRIGLPDSVLFNRYGTWWTTFLEGIGIDVVLPKASFADSLKVGQNAMPDEPATMQLLIGRVFELSTEVEALLIPNVNPGAEPGTRGAALEPWLVDLPTMLAQRFSLPTIYNVPARLETSETTGIAIRLGQTLTGNAQMVRRSLDKIQANLKPSHIPEPMWQYSGRTTIGLVADPLLLEQPFLIADTLTALETAGLHPIPISTMPRARAIEEGKRITPYLLEIDHEMIGSATLLAAKAAIRGLIYIAQPNAAAHRRLLKRSAHNTKKPTLTLEWNNLDLVALQEFAQKIAL
jgi:hypothetical protein